MKNFSTLLKSILCTLAVAIPALASANEVNLGYADKSDEVYPADGFSVAITDTVHVAIKLTREMLAPYQKGQITKILLGFSDYSSNPGATVWVRKNINGENLATGSSTIKFGWNEVKLSQPFSLEDIDDDLYVGFSTLLQANVPSIPTRVYGSTYANSQFMAINTETNPDGSLAWENVGDQRPIYLIATVDINSSDASNIVEIEQLRTTAFIYADTPINSIMTLNNLGLNNITRITLTYTQGDWTESETVKLSSSISAQSKSTVILPIRAKHSGELKVAVSKVNNKDNNSDKEFVTNVVAIPEEEAEKYVRKSLYEFYTSENNFNTPSYLDGIVFPSLSGFTNDIVFVANHSDDQFMLDEPGMRYNIADQLMIDMCDGDSLSVQMPSFLIDRSRPMVSEIASLFPYPAMSVLYSPYAESVFNQQLSVPTFASVDIESDYTTDSPLFTITAKGVVTPDVLPDGEYSYLNLYLVEDNVVSRDQIFWDEDETEDYNGTYTHQGIVRLMLTAPHGDMVETDAYGSYSMKYEAEIDPDYGWNPANMRLVAFLTRDFNNDVENRAVINANEIGLAKSSTSISSVESDGFSPSITVENCEIKVNSDALIQIYTTTGTRVNPGTKLIPGLYIVKSASGNSSAATKVFVK